MVDALGPERDRFRVGDRVGMPWLGGTDGTCRYCRRGDENLCLHPTFTGWDVDGGYADGCVVDEAVRLPLPDGVSGRAGRAAALRRDHRLPGAACGGRPARRPAGHLRLRRQRPPHRADRAAPGSAGARPAPAASTTGNWPRELGVDSVGDAADEPPEPLDGAILFAPAGELVPVALRALDCGGDPRRRRDLAVRHPGPELRPRTVPRAPAAQRHRQHPSRRRGIPRGWRPVRHQRDHRPVLRWPAPTALADLAHGRFGGAAVLHA